jgi:hypothetical protein
MDYVTTEILNPDYLKPYMFTKEISGKLNVFIPTKRQVNSRG